MPDLRSNLLNAQPCYGIPDADITEADRQQLVAWRREGWCRKMNGPGLPYWELTRRGRIELEGQPVAWVYREDF